MASAIGSSSAPVRSEHGEFWVDVRDFGAKADGGVTDNSGPIQAAIDALVAKLQGVINQVSPVGVVYIPTATNTYVVNKPIWVDSSNIEIRGDGWGSQVAMAFGLSHSVFIFGLSRLEHANVNGTTVPLQIDSTYRPDLFGKLDTSVVTVKPRGGGTGPPEQRRAGSLVQIQAFCPTVLGDASPRGERLLG